MIQAKIVADSLSPQGERLTSVLATFPRIILAEVNTHRMLSKNTSSSRAIPFHKMLKEIKDNPFIPMAFQKHHSGMQGTEYLDPTIEYNISDFLPELLKVVNNVWEEDDENNMSMQMYSDLLNQYGNLYYTPGDWWLFARDRVIESAILLHCIGVSKQLCNRLLEPFMWTTMLITGSKEGWDNFFNLRCPQYEYGIGENSEYFKSKKELLKHDNKYFDKPLLSYDFSETEWLKMNKGQAEIHMMDLAEKIYDAFEESTPKQLQAGKWHIPFRNEINVSGYVNSNLHEKFNNGKGLINNIIETQIKVSVAMAARTSYTIVGDEKEVDYSKLIDLHDRLIAQNPPHSSPMEHCAVAMTEHEYKCNVRGELETYGENSNGLVTEGGSGWCRNFRGFIPYRHLVESK